MATLFVDKLDPQSGTALEIGSSGDTITIPSGATITNNGTQTGFGGTMTPDFYVTKTDTNQSISNNTQTLITFNNEVRDSDSAFASNIFTVPSGKAGRYFLFATIYVGVAQDYNYVSIRKNVSTNILNMTRYWHDAADQSINMSGIVDAAVSDTFGVYLTQTSGGSKNVPELATSTFMYNST